MFQLPFATYMMRISFEAVPTRARGSRAGRRLRDLRGPARGPPAAVRPGIVTVGLFAFLAAWNDFFAPLILISDRRASSRCRWPW